MASTDYGKLKVTELKEVLKERGIPQTGLSRKQSIIEALEAQDGERGDNGGAVAVDAPEGEEAATGQTGENGEGGEVEAENAPAPEELQPVTVEAGEPVSSKPTSALGTPTHAAPEDLSSESKKRKRRSLTPEVREESVSKKLKATSPEPEVAAKDDRELEEAMVEDAPVPLDGAGDGQSAKTVQPYSTSDDVRDISAPEDDDLPALTPSQHPTTRALYIKNLLRPLQPNALREHLESLTGAADPASTIDVFHLDLLRTHAFVTFRSLSTAIRVREALNDTTFPAEPARKALQVDYVPAESVEAWIEKEMNAGGASRRDAKRWEVVYNPVGEDGVEAEHVEITSASHVGGRQGSIAEHPPAWATGEGMPNAPSGPRGREAQPQRTTHDAPPAARQPSLPPPEDPPAPTNTNSVPAQPSHGPASFAALAQKFQQTKCKPHLYFQPKSAAVAQERLEAMEQSTARDWQGGTARDWEGPLRRYTFEDGGKLVDGGADRGTFGDGGGYRGRGRGRGGFGGGSYRGGGGYGGGYGGGGYRGR